MRTVVALIAMLPLASAGVAETRTLLVPIATIAKGDVVSASGLRGKVFIVNDAQAPNWVAAIDHATGKEAKRTLLAGKPIPIAALKTPDAVKRGKPARAVYRTEGLEITTVLTPLEDAPAGASIKARSAETKVIVEALVQSDGGLLVVGR